MRFRRGSLQTAAWQRRRTGMFRILLALAVSNLGFRTLNLEVRDSNSDKDKLSFGLQFQDIGTCIALKPSMKPQRPSHSGVTPLVVPIDHLRKVKASDKLTALKDL
jgi:hypothetical protein